MRTTRLWIAAYLLAATIATPVSSSASTLQADGWPMAPAVEAQPLLAHARRVAQAMDSIGHPLPIATVEGIERLRGENDAETVTKEMQARLDPFCAAAAIIGENGVERVIPAPGAKTELIEQGWRAYLVKVVNRSRSTGVLRCSSPNAQPVPNAPASEVEKRWLGLVPYAGQPLRPNLSGLELEYAVLHLYARDAGEKTAELVFALEGRTEAAKLGPVIREWRFDDGASGWQAIKDCRLETDGGALRVISTGIDPHFAAPAAAKPGRLVLRFWAKFPKPGFGQIFWRTKERGQFDGAHLVNFAMEGGQGREYEVQFRSDGELAGIRIDPGAEPGTMAFDWIALSYETQPSQTASATATFTVKPSRLVNFRVRESNGAPAFAAFEIRDQAGRVYPAQAKRLAPDFFFHPQIYRFDGEQIRLPSGRYQVRCSRGPESVPETRELIVPDEGNGNQKPAELPYTVKRWIDPAHRGWWSGDHHIHAAGCMHYEEPTQGVHPQDMLRHIMGEDLKVGCCLTWGPCFDYQKRFFTGKPDDVSQYPYLLRYDVEVSGFGSHISGHLNLLRLREQIYPGGESKDHWPTLGLNTLRWAKAQGAVCGPAHSSIGLTQFVGRVEGSEDGPNGLPNYRIPSYDGIGANEFIMQTTHRVPGPDGKPVPAVDFISTMNTDRVAEWNMWYHVLNCGFRVRASGETDFPCVSGERVGMGRVYVKVDGKLEFDRWAQGIADGRSYVSDGTAHLMDFAAQAQGRSYDVGVNGSEIRLDQPGPVRFQAQVAVRLPNRASVPVELIVNGLPVARREIACDGQTRELTFEARIEKSSWAALRVFPHGHVNPFFILVEGKPIRASRQSAEWCLKGVDQCWTVKQKTYKADELEQAKTDYEHARKVYRQILEETRP